MKGLDALERIGKQKTKDTSFGVDIKTNCNKDYQIIEKELHALEIIKNYYDDAIEDLIEEVAQSKEERELLKEVLL